MDLESESSTLESVEDNCLIGEVEKIGDNALRSDEGDKFVFASASIVVETGNDEKTIDLVKQLETNSQVGTSTPVTKGQGLRKWRRLRRDLVKDTSLNLDSSKILKRGLSGSAYSLAKQMHLQSPDGKQDSLGSASSVNMLKNTGDGGSAVRESSYDTKLEGGIAFSAGLDSENSEDRSSRSSTAASAPKARYDKTMGHSWDKQRAKYVSGKTLISSGDSGQQGRSRIENSKKARGERIIIEKENSHSSMDSSDSRSSNFVFMQGASYTLSSRKQGGRMMDYNEENSDDGHTDGETPNRKDNAGEETKEHSQGDSGEESKNKNNGSSENLDPLKEAFKGFLTLQEALKREVLKFQELGKEPMSLHGGKHAELERACEASSSRQFGTENIAQEGLTSLDSGTLNLVNNVEHLEIKLEETKSMLEVKESHIRELESTIYLNKPSWESTRSNSESHHGRRIEIEIEEIFQQKMESEIEYLIFSRSVENLNKQMNMIEEQTSLSENQAHKMLSKLGEAETKAENLKNQAQDLQKHCVEITESQEVQSLKKKAFKTSSCLLLQLALLLLVVMLFISERLQKSEIVVPT